MILPIIFWTKIKKEKLGKLNTEDILDLLDEYLSEKGFNYINRKQNKIIFHKADGFTFMRMKDFLVSGEIRIKEKKDSLTITNGNWMIFLIAIPFLILYFLSKSEFSTFDKNDIQMIWIIFLILFIPNLIIRIVAHFELKGAIEKMIEKTTHNTV
ncbi:MAG: hypothetical protein QM499_01340 [Flavobacteriaceae bacterium]